MPGQLHGRHFSVFIVSLEQISHIVLMFLLSTQEPGIVCWGNCMIFTRTELRADLENLENLEEPGIYYWCLGNRKNYQK